MTGRRRLGGLLAAVLVLALTAGCAGLPQGGPVRVAQAREGVEGGPPVDFTPDGPLRGAPPLEIVRGFLVAMQATPVNTSVARQFLTAESRQQWVPEKGTIVYGNETRAVSGQDVVLALGGTMDLDGRGSWLGESGDQTFRLDMRRENGEWRISAPPDRLLIPRTHFETWFAQYSLYFFDKSAQVMVPEPVYVPTGAQASTSLVAGLLAGPERDLLGVERTFLPAGTELDDISVPVVQNGTAVVPLSDEVLDLDGERLQLAFAQLAWTLRQLPGIERMRVTVDGSPLDVSGSGPDVPLDAWAEYDPSVSWASQSLFGLRQGRVVTLVGGEEQRISGPFGSLDVDPRTVAVDLPAEHVAVTTTEGTVLTAPRSRPAGSDPTPADISTVYAGGDELLAPVWDLYGQLWVLDRTDAGAVLSVVRDGRTDVVDAPGITGEDVRSMTLSRDGTRLVAEVAGSAGDRVVLARVQRDHEGAVRWVDAAAPVRLGASDVRSIRDIAWRTPTSLALLTAPSPGTSKIVVVKVDGSSSAGESTTDAEVLQGAGTDLVTAPVLSAPLMVLTAAGQMFALATNGRWTGAGVRRGLQAPTFVG